MLSVNEPAHEIESINRRSYMSAPFVADIEDLT